MLDSIVHALECLTSMAVEVGDGGLQAVEVSQVEKGVLFSALLIPRRLKLSVTEATVAAVGLPEDWSSSHDRLLTSL